MISLESGYGSEYVGFIVISITVSVFFVSRLFKNSRLLAAIPSILFVYGFPMLLSNIGVLPSADPFYEWCSHYIPGFSIVLLVMGSDYSRLFQIGRPAILALVTTSAAMTVSCIVVSLSFDQLFSVNMAQPAALLIGTWIGGTANMIAIHQSIGATNELLSAVIVADYLILFTLLSILIFMARFQVRFDKLSQRGVEGAGIEVETVSLPTELRRPEVDDVIFIVGIGILSVLLAQWASDLFFETSPIKTISRSALAVILLTLVGLALSCTPARKLNNAGSSSIALAAMYILIATIGAQADLSRLSEAPVIIMYALVVIILHLSIVIVLGFMLQIPLSLIAVSTMSAVGGTVSGPLVAQGYGRSDLIPIAILFAVTYFLFATPLGVLVAALL
jgi:uncharacterized membrane protein